MNFKEELLAKVLAGTKTQTRRPVKDGDEFCVDYSEGSYVVNSRRTRYHMYQEYAACPGRGKPQQGRIYIDWIKREDVRQISGDDIVAEGFTSAFDFFKVWSGFYDKPMAKMVDNLRARFDGGDPDELHRVLSGELWRRPHDLYQAWALTFRLVTP